jgi:glycosyltransferase involved in cell wall biosynthesis
MISVIIATKNRDIALANISLPSLLNQKESDFEVILWDASDNSRTRLVAEKYCHPFSCNGVSLRYFPAPRQGSASQRNDAVEVASGDLIFFIDDDSEVSPDGISGLRECFASDPAIMGAALLVTESPVGLEKTQEKNSIKDRLYRLVGYRKKRVVSLSGSAKGIEAPAGPAQWLSGCSMAYRRSVFDHLRFNEKLETFGPYAMFEDIEFSHRVFLKYKCPLWIASRGKVTHRPVLNERVEGTEKKVAMYFFNRYLTMRVTSKDHCILGFIPFCWAVVRLLIKLTRAYGAAVVWRGFLLAFREVTNSQQRRRNKNV